ncbi:MAG: hypothetical protein ACRDNZ_04470 [Streptosporangiaceae bacterium]
MSQLPGDLQRQVEEFGQETAELLSATLPGLPDPPVEILQRQDRFIIGPPKQKPLPLYAGGQQLASIKVSLACGLDSIGRYLAIEESTFSLLATLDRAPVLRIHYYRTPRGKSSAHLHVHGHRGALSHLLSQAGHEHPHDMSALHIPLGGRRYRPCLEDFIQFLMCECKFDSLPDWQQHVEAGRVRWRCRQAAAVVRDVPEEAARVLRELGYTVEAPVSPPPSLSAKAVHTW